MLVKCNKILYLSLLYFLISCGSDVIDSENFSTLHYYELEVVETLSDQGDMIMGRPAFTVVDSDGNRIVMDLSTFELQVFDDDGNYRSSFGRQGDGPGEFRRPSNLTIGVEDTLYVSDNSRNALVVYAKSDSYHWEHAYDLVYPAIENARPFSGFTPTHVGYPVKYRVQSFSEEFPNGYSVIKLLNRDGQVIRVTGVKFRIGDIISLDSDRLQFVFSEIPDSQFSSHYDGTYFYAWTADPVIFHYSSGGELIREIHLEGLQNRYVTNQDIQVLNDLVSDQYGDITNQLREAIGEYFPVFSQIRVMHDDTIWLRRINSETSDESWYHFSPDGIPQGKLDLESGFRLRNSAGEYIYVSGTLENGSPAIICYRLLRNDPA
jgi:hypothetical protein